MEVCADLSSLLRLEMLSMRQDCLKSKTPTKNLFPQTATNAEPPRCLEGHVHKLSPNIQKHKNTCRLDGQTPLALLF